MSKNTKTVSDSMGEMQIPTDALYGAQTARAVDNFKVSGLSMPPAFILSLGAIKSACAQTNVKLGLMEAAVADAIVAAAGQVMDGEVDEHFPVDVFQTGSGTSSNMNANEVIATMATTDALEIHPNNHVNMSQSSNDTIPTAIHVSAALLLEKALMPALDHLVEAIESKAAQYETTVKTGRTHLMDAMPVTIAQEMHVWAAQIKDCQARLNDTAARVRQLPQGGTAVGTGINAPEGFSAGVCESLTQMLEIDFKPMENLFVGLAAQETALELSGQLKTLAAAITKIANDLRWMNSGPLTGLGEIELQALQPGSSIMPGKVNPVIPESAAMAAAQVMGNDTTIMMAAQSGNFQLNVQLPVIAYNLIQSLELMTNTAMHMADKAITTFTVVEDNLTAGLEQNPILVTALNRVIGYDLGAAIAKKAYAEKRAVLEVAKEMTDLSEGELKDLLNPLALTKGGIQE